MAIAEAMHTSSFLANLHRKVPTMLSHVLRHPLAWVVLVGAFSVANAAPAHAQLTVPRITSATDSRTATLEEQLVNRLRATTEEKRAYIRLVVQLVEDGQFEQRYVVAIERYAIRKNAQFPFPYFERAMRFEAEKRGIELPPVQLLAASPSTYDPRNLRTDTRN
jgi:hypothetical protein